MGGWRAIIHIKNKLPWRHWPNQEEKASLEGDFINHAF